MREKLKGEEFRKDELKELELKSE
jgi:hypothetical protein